MQQWFFSYSGDQIGPMSQMDAIKQAVERPEGFCWRQGFAEWMPIHQIDELMAPHRQDINVPPTPMAAQSADEVDFKLYGEDMQYVEIELDPGESAVAEAGAMMYKDSCIQLETVFGDGSRNGQLAGSFMDKLVGAGKRLITGESLFMTVFTHTGKKGKAHVAFAAPFPGTIIPMTLSNFDGQIICQKDSFLCAARGVSIGIHFQKKILTGLFGGEGFIMQKLEGDGKVFMHAGGTIMQRELAAGEQIQVDTGCLVALTHSVQYDVQQVGNIKSMLFGGEGVFFANLRGPGKIWLQSLPFSRLAGRMLTARSYTGKQGEGSVLGILGDIIDGD
jgi:uncharacterized protein (TIGR00266 family)